MRHLQYQRRAGTHGSGQAAFGRDADIAGQQDTAALAFDQQDAGAVVAARGGRGGGGAEHAQAHAIPVPGLPRDAGFRGYRHASGLACQPRCLRMFLRHCGRTSRMVVIRVADHQQIQPCDTQGAQRRQHRRLAEIELGGKTRTGIEHQGVLARTQHHRQSLPHVQHPQSECTVLRALHGRPDQRQQQQRAQPAHRRAARQQQPAGPEQRQAQSPRLYLGNMDMRAGQAGNTLEQPPQRRTQPSGQDQDRPSQRRRQHQQRRAEQDQRHDQEAHQRHRDQVRQRARQRGLAEEPQGQRQQRHRHHRLRQRQLAQHAAPALHARGQAVHQEGHPGEGQPEARTQYGKRIDRKHGEQSQGQRLHRRHMPPRTACERDYRDHQQGAHGRQAEAGQRAVESGEQQRGQRLHLPPRHAQPERGPQRIGQPHQPHTRHRRHADMKAGDGDQMRSAIRARHLPIVLAQAARIAYRERAQQRRGADIGDMCGDALGDGRARSVDAPCARIKAGVGRPFAHIACSDRAALERTALTVTAARIDQAARPLEPHRQTPARTGRDRRSCPIPRHIPRKPHHAAQRDRLVAYRRPLHLQQEPCRFIALLRQAGHGADHDQIAPFQRPRQPRLHRPRTAPGGPGSTKHEEDGAARRRQTPGKPAQQDKQRHHPAFRRQHRHPLHREHTGQKSRRQPDHSMCTHGERPSLAMAFKLAQ